MSDCCNHQHQDHHQPTMTAEPQREPAPGARLSRVRIEQMDCPTEEALIRGRLGGMPGVLALEFNLLQRVLSIHHLPDALEAALEAIRDLGFSPVAEGGDAPESVAEPRPRDETVRACPDIQDAQVVAYFLHLRVRKPALHP